MKAIRAVGYAVMVLGNLAGAAAFLAVMYFGVVSILDGQIILGVVLIGFVATLAASLASVLGVPGAALVAIADRNDERIARETADVDAWEQERDGVA